MAKPFQISPQELKNARLLLKNHTNEREYRCALIVIFLADNIYTAEQIADHFEIGVRTVFEDLERIRSLSLKNSDNNEQWGGRRHCLMTEEEEASFLEGWHEKSVAGTIVTIPELHAALSQRLGKKIPLSTTYRMLKRHGWRKIKPDTRHPKGDPNKQDEFKKKHSQNLWRKFP